MKTDVNNRNLSPWARIEGPMWLVLMCLISLVSAFPAELPASWLVVGIGLVTLLRMGSRGLPYVALAALFVSFDFVTRKSIDMGQAIPVCLAVALLITAEVWFAWRAVVWLQNHRREQLLSRASDVFPFALLVCLLPPVLITLAGLLLIWAGMPQVVSDSELIPLALLLLVRNAMGLLLIGPLYWAVPRLASVPKPALIFGWLFFSLPVLLNETLYFGLAILAYPAAILIAKTLRFGGIVVAVTISSILSLGYTSWLVEGNEGHLVAQWLLDTVLFSTTLGIVALYSALSFEELEARGEHLEYLVAERTGDLERANQRLTEMASIDPLTGIANRRQWNTRAELAVAQAAFTDEPLSVMLIDLDYFKKVNDQYGHDVGDQVLKQFAERCNDVLRTGDTLARLGGEEFSLMLQGAGLDQAARVARKLHQLVRGGPFLVDDSDKVNVTVSIGVAEWRPREDSISAAMKRADKALYKAKHSGRDKVLLEPRLQVRRPEQAEV